jgi:hypothetical protein
MNAIIASVKPFTKGGSSRETDEEVSSNIRMAPKAVTRPVNKPAKMATTAAAMTEAEGFAELAIKTVYTISREGKVREAEGNAE